MARRTYQKANPGRVYCIEWPEWHVDCAGENCENSRLVAPLGEAGTAVEAERRAKADADGWVCRKGFWFCPACEESQNA